MLVEDKKNKGLFAETDSALAQKFREAGFGFGEGEAPALHPLEAAYLARAGKSSLEKGGLPAFIAAQKKKDALFPFALAVYSAIRGTGRLVRPYAKGFKYLRAYAPGVGREKDRPSQLVCLLPGKVPTAKSISEDVRLAHLARLDLIIACGSEKEAKYYKISSFNF